MDHRCGSPINSNFVKWNSCGAHFFIHFLGKFKIFRAIYIYLFLAKSIMSERWKKCIRHREWDRPYFTWFCVNNCFFFYIGYIFLFYNSLMLKSNNKTRNSHKINVSFVQRNHALNHRNTHRSTRKKKMECVSLAVGFCRHIHYSKLAASIWSRQFLLTLAACTICLVMPISKAQLNTESNANIP